MGRIRSVASWFFEGNKAMSLKVMGKKRGMTQIFDEEGRLVPCTVIEAEPNVVTQVKTKESDGYSALQLGFEKVQVKDPRTVQKRLGKPQSQFFEKIGVAPRRHLHEVCLESVEGYQVGQEIGVESFVEVTYVDVVGVSKGKGYQGVMKLHNFKGGPGAHGSGFHRHAGSTGMRTTPGRCLPGGPRASHMGSERVTVQSLRVMLVDKEKGTLFVLGAVPGPVGGLVCVCAAEKKKGQGSKK